MSTDLGEFLRSRRGRLHPADVGLRAAGPVQRKVPGLRREEVAELAGVSADYYTRLERGRGRQISDSVLASIGQALRLSATEQAYLLALARPPAAVVTDDMVRPGLRLLLDGIRDVPALIVDHRMTVVAANALAAAVFGITDDPLSRDRARNFFLDPRSRSFFPDWDADAESMAAELRVQAARHPGDRKLVALIAELSAASAIFRRLWADHAVREKTDGVKRIIHPVVGELTLFYERLTAAGGDQRLLAYATEPGSPSAGRLATLASRVTGLSPPASGWHCSRTASPAPPAPQASP